tara:strand:- start:900 stop:1535 length:636 start_codon:yes stop_codon:yes gene_type:complete
MSAAITAAVVTVGAGMYGANRSEIAGRKAQTAQQEMEQRGLDTQLQMQERAIGLMQPYTDAGYGALSGLQGLTDPAQRAQMLGDYYKSDEYNQMAGQASANAMRGASAQGGLRGGSTYSALENVAPQLGQSFLSNQYNQLTGLANMGMGSASQGANSYSNLGSNMANTYSNIGAGQANQMIAAQNSQNQALSGGIGALSGAFGSYFGRGKV